MKTPIYLDLTNVCGLARKVIMQNAQKVGRRCGFKWVTGGVDEHLSKPILKLFAFSEGEYYFGFDDTPPRVDAFHQPFTGYTLDNYSDFVKAMVDMTRVVKTIDGFQVTLDVHGVTIDMSKQVCSVDRQAQALHQALFPRE